MPSTNTLLKFRLGLGGREDLPVSSPPTQVDVGRLPFLSGCFSVPTTCTSP